MATVEDLYRQILGREPDAEGLAYWQNAFGGSVDPTEQASFMKAAQGELANRSVEQQATLAPNLTTSSSTPAVVAQLTDQILSQGTADKWTGEGYGSAQANAAAMAKRLAEAGITDIKQFGKVDKYEPVDVIGKTYNGNRVYQTSADEYGNGGGSYYYNKPTGGTDYEGNPIYQVVTVPQGAKVDDLYGVADVYGESYNPIDPSKVVVRDGVPTIATGQTFGNKVTGEAIESGSGRWQNQGGEGIFSGTGEGKGNTAFRAEFAPDGTPIFYTTQGSSSDLPALMPLIQIGLAATGAGGLLGNALLGAGASQVATGALGNAILGGVTSSLAGGDWKKGALLGGAGGALGGYLQGGPIDASNMTATQFNDALESQLIGEMQRSGLTNAQITQFLENASPADIASITSALPVTGASDNLLVNAARTPITSDALINTLSQIPTVAVTAKAPEQVSPDVLSNVTSILGGATTTTPTVEIKDTKPAQSDNSATVPIITSPITTNLPTSPTTGGTTGSGTSSTGNLTTSDVIKLLGIGTTIAGINAATGGGGGGVTQYPIVEIPSDWRTPPKPSVAPATVLPPINFGDRNLLIGTQWEKFLDPNYGQVPEPVQYSQPSNLSYNDLMGILGSKQGMPSASSLSINDIISGIQNQYGQANRSSMG